MGIRNYIAYGIQSTLLERDRRHAESPVFRHPADAFAVWSTLLVEEGEVAVFLKDGQYVGELPAGRHILQASRYPYLAHLVDEARTTDYFFGELYFATIGLQYNRTVGTWTGAMIDPTVGIEVNPYAECTYAFRVSDPLRLVQGVRLAQLDDKNPQSVHRWIDGLLCSAVQSALARAIREGETTLLDIPTAGKHLMNGALRASTVFLRNGVELTDVVGLRLALSEQDERKVSSIADRIVDAKIVARQSRPAPAPDSASSPGYADFLAKAKVTRKQFRDHGEQPRAPASPQLPHQRAAVPTGGGPARAPAPAADPRYIAPPRDRVQVNYPPVGKGPPSSGRRPDSQRAACRRCGTANQSGVRFCAQCGGSMG